jgi:hypothetical protein
MGSKNPGPEGPALTPPRGVKCTERRSKEVMPVLERPYLKKKFHPAMSWREIFRSYGKAYDL